MDNVPLHVFPLSPATRRRNRGRGVVVLDNVTASTMTNSTYALLDSYFPDLLNGRSAAPSPDEIVIQARGRRALPLTFSPDVHHTPLRYREQRILNNMSPRQDSTGSQSRLLLPTRSSPRKRLTLNDSPSGPTELSLHFPVTTTATPFDTPSPDKFKRSPLSKKCRMERIIGPPGDTTTPIDVSLKGLSQQQLVKILSQLIENKPEIESEISAIMPEPDLGPLEERLSYLKKNVFRSLPKTRLESRTDSMAYNRVATHLLAFKKAVIDQAKNLAESEHWAALLDYSLMAWLYVKATPIWDNTPHNGIRNQCFKNLATNCMLALKRCTWPIQACRDIKSKLVCMKSDSEEVFACIKHVDHVINSGNNNNEKVD